ncbi:hypothetical protein HOY80DRAFT_1000883 [Tuber brumale]|nr:hypothetical protein HOY80DRAFT_1000883 [Tuber brumale]
MFCFAELFSCLRSRKGDGVRDSTGGKSLISPPAFLIHASNPSSFPAPGESNSRLLPLPQRPQPAYAVEKGIVYLPDPRGSPASVDYFSDETYAILMKKREESLAAGAASYSDGCAASCPKLDTEIRDVSDNGIGREGWDISNDDIGLKQFSRIYTEAMNPMIMPSPSLEASAGPGCLDPGGPFLSLLEEYDPSPVKYSTSLGKSGTYREATLSLSPERMNLNRDKQQCVTETMGSLNIRATYARRASPGSLKSRIDDNDNTPKEPDSSERVANDHSPEVAMGPSITSDPYDKKKLEDSSGNTIGIYLRGEEDSGPRQKLQAEPNGDASSSESTTTLDSSNLSHLRALVAPSESNLTSSESLLSYGLHSSNLRKRNFYTPSEIGALEESANLLSSVQDYEPSPPTDASSVYSSEQTSTLSFAGVDGGPINPTFPSPVPDRNVPHQTQNSYLEPNTRSQKKTPLGPIFYPPAGRARALDIGNICSIYPDRFPYPLQKLRRVTDHKAGDNSKNIQVQPRSSSYGAVPIGVGGSRPTSPGAWHEEHYNRSGAVTLQITSYGLSPQYFPGIESTQSKLSSKDNSKAILATPTNQFAPVGRLKSSISLSGRIRGHGLRNGEVDARRRASTNSLGNLTTSGTENIDENSGGKSRAFGRRLNMSQSLSKLKNRMHETNNKIFVGTTVYHLSSHISGGAFKDEDKERLRLESCRKKGMEEGMKCSMETDKTSEGILEERTENNPIELASNGLGDRVSVIEANSERDLTGYEDCVMLPFSLTSSETLGVTQSREELAERVPSTRHSCGHKENRLKASPDV